MNLRSLVLSSLAASTLMLAASANAHDPSLHEDHAPPEAKVKPVNCKQLADNEHFSNDMGDPDIKALKTKCDAEQKAATEPVPGKIN